MKLNSLRPPLAVSRISFGGQCFFSSNLVDIHIAVQVIFNVVIIIQRYVYIAFISHVSVQRLIGIDRH
jgi:hypothetical protein